MLIIDGARDPRPRWAVDSLERALPAVTRVILPGAGHMPWLEEPAEFPRYLLDFLGAAELKVHTCGLTEHAGTAGARHHSGGMGGRGDGRSGHGPDRGGGRAPAGPGPPYVGPVAAAFAAATCHGAELAGFAALAAELDAEFEPKPCPRRPDGVARGGRRLDELCSRARGRLIVHLLTLIVLIG